MDTYSHAAEVQFSFEVCSFNTESGRMEIMTQSPAEAFVPSDEEIQSRLKRIRSRIREMEKEHEDSEHAVVPNRSLPSSQKSTSPVSGSED